MPTQLGRSVHLCRLVSKLKTPKHVSPSFNGALLKQQQQQQQNIRIWTIQINLHLHQPCYRTLTSQKASDFVMFHSCVNYSMSQTRTLINRQNEARPTILFREIVPHLTQNNVRSLVVWSRMIFKKRLWYFSSLLLQIYSFCAALHADFYDW